MAFISIIQGPIRASREMTKKNSAEVFGRIVSVLTETDGVLGETVGVMLWDRDAGHVSVQPGEQVEWVVETRVGQYGLDVSFKKDRRAGHPRDLPAPSIVHSLAEPVPA